MQPTSAVSASPRASDESQAGAPRAELIVLTGGGTEGAFRVLSMLMQRAYAVHAFMFELDESCTDLVVVRCAIDILHGGDDLLLSRLRRLPLVVRAEPEAGCDRHTQILTTEG